MNEERTGKCLRQVFPRSLIYVFRITMHFLQKYPSTLIRCQLFVDILLSSLIYRFFPVSVLKQYTNFDILAGVLHQRGKKLLSVYSSLFILSLSHFLLYFYVFTPSTFQTGSNIFYKHGNGKSQIQKEVTNVFALIQVVTIVHIQRRYHCILGRGTLP